MQLFEELDEEYDKYLLVSLPSVIKILISVTDNVNDFIDERRNFAYLNLHISSNGILVTGLVF